MKRPTYATEAELCADFIAWMARDSWVAYPETAGWDILFVNSDGHQLGVQAKLRLNFEVISQAMPATYGSDVGPDHRAILVPTGKNSGADLCTAVGLEVYYGHGRYFSRANTGYYGNSGLFDWNPSRRHPLPAYIPDVVAGASGPIQLTKWKIAALKILATLEIDGFVTIPDFARAGIDRRRWISQRWLEPDPTRKGAWVRGENLPAFDQQHPVVYPQIRDEVAEANRGMVIPTQIDLGGSSETAA